MYCCIVDTILLVIVPSVNKRDRRHARTRHINLIFLSNKKHAVNEKRHFTNLFLFHRAHFHRPYVQSRSRILIKVCLHKNTRRVLKCQYLRSNTTHE